ncbi:THO complex component [Coccidioides posadasii str. Silveira]|uniref:THO complex subunit 2 n=1 Tax=Coccidioides posadasii (strain RMSCC 757 / Silveira) TaxID=443226 RepID=E9CUD7_COCPS|nr:THO complex component [Coccidioides posadasii str. Silveira]
MPPGTGNKRKRGDRSWSGDWNNDGSRPSPHRPANLNLAQQQQSQYYNQSRDGGDTRGRGGRRASRGNRNNRRGSDGSSFQLRESSRVASPLTADEPKLSQTNGLPAPAITESPTPQPQVSKKAEPSSYAYDYLTDDRIKNWSSTGKQQVVEVGKEACSNVDTITLASLFQEVIQSAFECRIPPVEGGAVVKQIIGERSDSNDGDRTAPYLAFDSHSIFLDTLSILTDADSSRENLRPLAFATGISPSLMRLQLDTPLLQALGLIRDTFGRMGIRKQTNILYRQSNYNLLREESEGYSKLLTELFTTSNNEPPSSEVVEDTFERVKAMIGAFDMDVGRVLDVTLDVFAAVLVKQYRFCVKFLRASSWWPKEDNAPEGGIGLGLPKWALPGSPGWSTTDEEREEALRLNEHRDRLFWDRAKQVGIKAFFEIGRSLASDSDNHMLVSDIDVETRDETQKWIEQTGTLPPKGNRVAAQLLGFKLRFYSSDARNATDVLPDNLIYLAALLIKVGFISLRDLYPHLWRPDEEMEVLKEEKMKEKAEREKAGRRGAGMMNALMTAGALADDTLTLPARSRGLETRSATPAKEQEQDKDKTAPQKTEEKEQLPEPADQKVLLLKSLLAIGALPESLYILGRFPWLLDGYPELPEYIHRILHYCLHKVYQSVQPLPSRSELRDRKKIVGSEQGAVSQGRVRLSDAAPQRVLRWALLDKQDNDGTDYRFYWDDWTDSIPVCQSIDDVFALCSSFLNLSGVKIGQDPSLLTKLARIGKHSLKEDVSESNRTRWMDLCRRLLVPALSLTKNNPGVVNEVFELLNYFPQHVRFSIYAEWYFGQTSRLPDIKSAFDQARFETKDALKRLSKTNVRPMARTLAKIAYANPGIVINVAVGQIESYENLIEVVVECARYFTYLGYDILTWSLINSLGQKGRSRMQESGLLTSRWLNSLASFAGRVFKRYSSIVNPVPVLQYVAEQLRQNNSTDLIVLEQLISSMAGIVTDTNFNDAQVQAMAGGEVLQSQTMLQLLDKRHESKTTSKRLMRALTDSKLAGQLLIAIAQERVTCVFKESEADIELKLLGNIFDEIHRVLTQYLDLLRANFTVEEFDSFVPDVSSLIGEFGIQTEVAFWISRPSIAHRVLEHDKRQREAESKKAESEAATPSKTLDADVEMGESGDAGQSPEEIGPGDFMTVDSTSQEAQKDSQESSANPPTPSGTNEETTPWHPVLDEMMEKMKSKLPHDLWEVVGLPFYATFWQLSLNDIYVPQKSYEDELERQKKKVIAISSDRSDLSIAGTQRKEREKKQVNELHERILLEHKRHVKGFTQTRARLQKERDKWFAGMRGKHDALNLAIIQQCLLPRLLLSPVDALYCFKILKYLHSSGTPNFRTVGLLDQFFRDQRLTSIIFQCTSKEADNLGRFLNEVFRDLARWHADKTVYEKEAYGAKRDLPGFATAVDSEGKPSVFLDYEDFRRILYKWHRLFGAALKTCLTCGEYMHIRNAISVLKAVVQHFPALNWIGTDMLTIVNNLKTTDSRDDVKIPAASLIGDLQRREKKWLLPQAFMLNQSVAAEKTAGAKSATPQSRSATPKAGLNAAAPEFKPTSAPANANGVSKSEVEEGEVDDARAANAKKAAQAQNSATPLAQPSPSQQTSGTEPTVDEQNPIEVDRQGANANEQLVNKAPPEPSAELPRETQSPIPPRNTTLELRPERRPRSEASQPANIPKRPEVDWQSGPRNATAASKLTQQT